MKLTKTISELARTNFVPVEETKEGLLRGGFGEILAESESLRIQNNCSCSGNNCNCYGDVCGPVTTTTTSTSKSADGIQFVF